VDAIVTAANEGVDQERLERERLDRVRVDQESLGLLVRSAHRAFVRALAKELAPHGISNAEWSALRVLWRLPGPTQVELAEQLAIEKASVTPVLAALERKGLVTRHRDPTDKRKTRLVLTPAGHQLEAALLPLGARVNARAASGLTQQQRDTLRALLHHLTDHLTA
jgi:MarR family transcriptional regulator, organic hydroperoxide resistance regulator